VENGLSELQRHQFHAKALSRLISISSPSENRSSGISLMAAVQSLSYDLIFGKSAINKSDIKYLFDPPFVFELLGDEFVKEFGDSYYSLRHPRIIRMRRDMDWKETLSFEEYQVCKLIERSTDIIHYLCSNQLSIHSDQWILRSEIEQRRKWVLR
jgi:hypothetical protein